MRERVVLQYHHKFIIHEWFEGLNPNQIPAMTEEYVLYMLFNSHYPKLEKPDALNKFKLAVKKAAEGYLTGNYETVPDEQFENDTICNGCAYLEGKICTKD